MNDLRIENEELKVRVRLMAAMLEKIEWANFWRCYYCRRFKISGHKDDCEWKIVMALESLDIGERTE